ncbi:MAG: LytR C-terminal domain-containing protein [Gaiellaceae bacterium]
MDHPLTAFDTVRPWRTATLVAVGVAAVELVLLVIVGGTLFARHATTDATPARAHTVRPAPIVRATPRKHTAVHLSRHQVSVLVLNGNGHHGAASSAAAMVRRHGYPVRGVGNAQRMDYTRSIVMYRPGFEAEGRRLGRDLRIAIVGPLDGLRPAQLHGGKAVLVVG